MNLNLPVDEGILNEMFRNVTGDIGIFVKILKITYPYCRDTNKLCVPLIATW